MFEHRRRQYLYPLIFALLAFGVEFLRVLSNSLSLFNEASIYGEASSLCGRISAVTGGNAFYSFLYVFEWLFVYAVIITFSFLFKEIRKISLLKYILFAVFFAVIIPLLFFGMFILFDLGYLRLC